MNSDSWFNGLVPLPPKAWKKRVGRGVLTAEDRLSIQLEKLDRRKESLLSKKKELTKKKNQKVTGKRTYEQYQEQYGSEEQIDTPKKQPNKRQRIEEDGKQ